MQQIERVGAVALLFLLVTIVAVAMWDDGDSGEVNAARPEDDQTAAAQAGGKADQQATRGRQRPQGNQNQQKAQAGQARERHDGLQATRANGRGAKDNLLGSTGQVAQVPPRGPAANVVDPIPAPVQERPVQRGNDRPIETSRDQQLLNERGWDNGRRGSIQEQPVVADKVAERPARKRKQDPQKGNDVRLGGQTHVVQKNESLERIARSRLGDGQRWPEIAAINGIEGPNYVIRQGQSLRLPGGAKPQEQAAPARRENPAPRAQVVNDTSGGRTYEIKSGDVLGVISQRELGTSKRWKEIVALNPGLDPKKLLVGTTILLPAGGTPAPERSSLVANVRADADYRVR